MERMEEYTLEGRSFVFLDLSMLKNNLELSMLVADVNAVIEKYPKASLHMIINIAEFKLDSESIRIFEGSLSHIMEYTKSCAFIGVDGVKKMVVGAVAKRFGKTDIRFAFTRERATEMLLGG